MCMTVDFLGQLSWENVLRTVSAYNRPQVGDVLVDMSHVTFVKPCGLVTLRCWIDKELEAGVAVIVRRPMAADAFRYLQNMDFFSGLDIFQNEQFHRHEQSGRFARMARIDWASDSTAIAYDLVSTLAIDDSDRVHGELFNCLEESITNLHSHARSFGYAAAQSYNRAQPNCRYEIAICDPGRGVRASLSDNDDYRIDSDVDALRQACVQGVSGALYRHGPGQYQQHFGEGLFTIDTIARTTHGYFALASGESVRVRQQSAEEYRHIPRWEGTIVSLVLNHTGIIKWPGHRPDTGHGRVRFE